MRRNALRLCPEESPFGECRAAQGARQASLRICSSSLKAGGGLLDAGAGLADSFGKAIDKAGKLQESLAGIQSASGDIAVALVGISTHGHARPAGGKSRAPKTTGRRTAATHKGGGKRGSKGKSQGLEVLMNVGGDYSPAALMNNAKAQVDALMNQQFQQAKAAIDAGMAQLGNTLAGSALKMLGAGTQQAGDFIQQHQAAFQRTVEVVQVLREVLDLSDSVRAAVSSIQDVRSALSIFGEMNMLPFKDAFAKLKSGVLLLKGVELGTLSKTLDDVCGRFTALATDELPGVGRALPILTSGMKGFVGILTDVSLAVAGPLGVVVALTALYELAKHIIASSPPPLKDGDPVPDSPGAKVEFLGSVPGHLRKRNKLDSSSTDAWLYGLHTEVLGGRSKGLTEYLDEAGRPVFIGHGDDKTSLQLATGVRAWNPSKNGEPGAADFVSRPPAAPPNPQLPANATVRGRQNTTTYNFHSTIQLGKSVLGSVINSFVLDSAQDAPSMGLGCELAGLYATLKCQLAESGYERDIFG